MEAFYKQDFTLSHMHVDRFGRATPAALLYLVQEVAGSHCALLEVDHNTLSKQNLFWAVTRNRVQVTRLPQLGETVYVETWPMPTTRVAYPRSMVAYDASGNECFRSISLWVLMDLDTRNMILPGKSGISVDGTLRGNELASPMGLVAKSLSRQSGRTVCFTDLDRNGHMNNTRYLDWINDLLPSDFHREHPPRELTVCYLSEAREGQQLNLGWDFLEEGCLQVDAHRCSQDKNERIFSARILYD